MPDVIACPNVCRGLDFGGGFPVVLILVGIILVGLRIVFWFTCWWFMVVGLVGGFSMLD